ncbi:MAG: hypothetical protein IJ064_02425 [Bacteroidaceae bacterium]|nr:hypothetical protein [Bacteroidaceae bacterium]
MTNEKSLLPLLFLLLLTACTGRSDRMLRQLEHLEEMNRTDQPLRVDSVLPLVRYYDHWLHRTPLLRLRAYYMLGSAYRDQGEAPAALHYYNIATEKADTLHPDSATAATLFRVYGQMALIYEQQDLPRECLNAWLNYSRYAGCAKDTINYVLGILRTTVPYYILNDTANVLRTTEKAYRLYKNMGFLEKAARVYPTAIVICLANKNYSQARQYMNTFEGESGLFDEHGNIEAGREQYYDSKGKYYMGMGCIDSAEYYFRKLCSYGYLLEGCEGMIAVYEKKGNADSIVKYTQLYKEAQVRWAVSRQSDAIIQSSAMYNYERNMRIAEQREREADTLRLSILLLIFAILLTATLVFVGYQQIRRQKERREMEYKRLVEEHQHIQIMYNLQSEMLRRQEEEYKTLRNKSAGEMANYGQILADKESEIQRQREILNGFRQDILEREELLKREGIVIDFRRMAENGYNGKRATKKEWEKLVRAYRQYIPHMYARMQVAHLTERELRICILTYLEFSGSDIVILMDISKQIVSNTRLSGKRKLFGKEESLPLVKCLKKYAYLQR